MDRNEIHPEIEALLEELGRALATELEGREVFAASCQIGRVLWFGRWWVEIAPGKFIPDDFEA